MTAATPSRSTPVLYVDAIEPSLEFWRDRLGFRVDVEVPHGDALGFVILRHGAVEVMLQTTASLAADAPEYAQRHNGDKTFLFIEVDDIDAIARSLDGCDVVLPRRTTFYGATEIGYREPGGHYATFAQIARAPEAAG